jgi:hypothetical protein
MSGELGRHEPAERVADEVDVLEPDQREQAAGPCGELGRAEPPPRGRQVDEVNTMACCQ